MPRPLTLTSCGILLCAALSASAAFAQDATRLAEADVFSTRTVTHIDVGPLGLMKLVLPAFHNANDPSDAARENLDFSLLGLLDVEMDRDGPHTLTHVSLCRIPFLALRNLGDKHYGKDAGGGGDNPFDLAHGGYYYDQPLFCLGDRVVIDDSRGQATGTPQTGAEREPLARRARLLDSLLFTLYQEEAWDHGKQYRKEWLDVPLATVAAYQKADRLSYVKILDTEVASVFRHTDAPGHGATKVLDAGPVGLFHRERSPEKTGWSFVKAPMASLATSLRGKEKDTLIILGTANINSSLSIWRPGPLFAVWQHERAAEGQRSLQALRLPLLGPVWASWQDDENQARWGLFPRLVFRRDFPY